MAMFVEDPADHWREEHAVGEWPIRNCETGSRTRHHAACKDQEGGAQSREYREPVEPEVVWFRSRYSLDHLLVSCFCGKREVQFGRFAVSQSDRANLLAVTFMPGDNFVCSRRQGQGKVTGIPACCMERVIEHTNKGLHPPVDIAAHRQRHLRLSEDLHRLHVLNWLADVERAC